MTTIFYYSSRGNSFWAARELAAGLGETRLLRIDRELVTRAYRLAPDEAIGFVVPTIDFGLPISLRRLIGTLELGSGRERVFAALTTGGMPAGTLGQLERLLSRKGFALDAAILLPFSLRSGEEEIREGRLKELGAAIRENRPLAYGRGGLGDRLFLSGVLNFIARLMIPREDAKFAVSAACDGCGLCARLCPSANIKLAGGRPAWGHDCEQCGSCFAWCPREAITGTCLAAKTRYRNPQIGLGELLRAKEGRDGPELSGQGLEARVEASA